METLFKLHAEISILTLVFAFDDCKYDRYNTIQYLFLRYLSRSIPKPFNCLLQYRLGDPFSTVYGDLVTDFLRKNAKEQQSDFNHDISLVYDSLITMHQKHVLCLRPIIVNFLFIIYCWLTLMGHTVIIWLSRQNFYLLLKHFLAVSRVCINITREFPHSYSVIFINICSPTCRLVWLFIFLLKYLETSAAVIIWFFFLFKNRDSKQ